MKENRYESKKHTGICCERMILIKDVEIASKSGVEKA